MPTAAGTASLSAEVRVRIEDDQFPSGSLVAWLCSPGFFVSRTTVQRIIAVTSSKPLNDRTGLMNTGSQEEIARDLESRAQQLRERFADDVRQLDDVYALYNLYVSAGVAFPLDLEEHSLVLILRHVRPSDNVSAARLAAVLRLQGKPVPAEMADLAGRYVLRSHEFIAQAVRDAISAAETSGGDAASNAIHRRLFYVFGLPKSASRLLVSVLAAMHPDERFRKSADLPYSTGQVGIDAVSDLRLEQLRDFSGGGVAHSHANSSAPTRYTLSRLSIGHVVTVRHPADHIAALYCHVRNIANGLPKQYVDRLWDTRGRVDQNSLGSSGYDVKQSENDLNFHHIIFPLDPRLIFNFENIDAAISHMISGGYLYYALSWIVDWQLFRVRSISSVVRYEDFMQRSEAVIEDLNDLIFSQKDGPSLQRGLDHFASKKSYKPSLKKESYPRGPAGSPGAWKAYFSDENRVLYNQICKSFIDNHPYGKAIVDLYPDIFI